MTAPGAVDVLASTFRSHLLGKLGLEPRAQWSLRETLIVDADSSRILGEPRAPVVRLSEPSTIAASSRWLPRARYAEGGGEAPTEETPLTPLRRDPPAAC